MTSEAVNLASMASPRVSGAPLKPIGRLTAGCPCERASPPRRSALIGPKPASAASARAATATTAAPTQSAKPDRGLGSSLSRVSGAGPPELWARAPRRTAAVRDRRHDHRHSTDTIVKAATKAAARSRKPLWLEPAVRCDPRNFISLLALGAHAGQSSRPPGDQPIRPEYALARFLATRRA